MSRSWAVHYQPQQFYVYITRYHRQHRRGLEMDKTSDSELLERAQRGDSAAFSTLIRRHDRYLYRVARSVVRDDDEAADVVQQTYLRVFTKIGEFRGHANLRTWLTRIALNDALRRKRRQRSFVELGKIDVAEERSRSQVYLSALSNMTPEDEAARSQMRQLLERAIDDLPSAFRTVVVLRDVEGASVEETANVLGIQPETVRTRHHRARVMLRESLGTQIASIIKDVFPFERPRCDALVRRLLGELVLPPRSGSAIRSE
jgi:RNA polymerase sigma-70 factor (ECF subfamily)